MARVDPDALVAAAGQPVGRDEALGLLRELARRADAKAAHVAAEIVLLRLVGDVEVAEAFAAVPRGYA